MRGFLTLYTGARVLCARRRARPKVVRANKPRAPPLAALLQLYIIHNAFNARTLQAQASQHDDYFYKVRVPRERVARRNGVGDPSKFVLSRSSPARPRHVYMDVLAGPAAPLAPPNSGNSSLGPTSEPDAGVGALRSGSLPRQVGQVCCLPSHLVRHSS